MIYRSNFKAVVEGGLAVTSVPGQTAYSFFLQGVKVAGDDAPCLGRIVRPSHAEGGAERAPPQKPYFDFMTYSEVHELILIFGSALNHFRPSGKGVPVTEVVEMLPGRTERLRLVGFNSLNLPEWEIADIACSAYGFTSVMVHALLPPEQAGSIIRDAGEFWQRSSAPRISQRRRASRQIYVGPSGGIMEPPMDWKGLVWAG